MAAATEESDPPSRVARLSAARGSVSFQPAGESEWVTAVLNRPLTTGDRLWTDGGDARAELSMGALTVRLGPSTDFGFIGLDDGTVQMQLTQGTLTVRVQRVGRDEVLEVDTPNQAFSILQAGSYRVEASADGAYTLVTVRAGEGEATGGGEAYGIHSRESVRLTGADRLEAADLRPGPPDELDDWGQARDRRSDASPSARYVSHEVVGYEDLDDNGTWSEDPSYGHVWIPTRTAAGWAPYHDGHWAWISPWGYTWVDEAPWGYAPFHYGRWVTIRDRWGWVPGPVEVQAVYAPALVAFIGGPGFSVSLSVGGDSEVGWFPLGPREVYVPGYHTSRGYVDRVNVSNTRVTTTTITNVYNTQITNTYSVTNEKYVNRTAPGGVTVVPKQAFTSAQPVARAAVKVNEQRIAAAPVGRAAVATPTRDAVFGPTRTEGAPRPPAAAASRAVIAKAPPPPRPVPFASQQKALEAHPGQPLAGHEVESLRPPAAAAARPPVQQAPPSKPATAAPAQPAEAVATPLAPKPPVKAAQRVAPAQPAEQVATPPAPRPPVKAAQRVAPAKPAEQVATPPAPRPPVKGAQRVAPAKPAEQVATPPAPRPPVKAAQRVAPTKPAEQVATPPAPRSSARARPPPERAPAAADPQQHARKEQKEKPGEPRSSSEEGAPR